MRDASDLEAFLSGAWQHLTRGVADATSPARTPVLATVSPDGLPEARMVVLRAASRRAGTIEIHSDTQTAKVAALRGTPTAALHVWVPKARLQIRMTAQMEIRSGATVAPQWQKVPPGSRVSYGTQPAPGMAIAHAQAYDTPADPARFAVLHGTLRAIDLLHLGETHRRAVFLREDDWHGRWVAP